MYIFYFWSWFTVWKCKFLVTIIFIPFMYLHKYYSLKKKTQQCNLRYSATTYIVAKPEYINRQVVIAIRLRWKMQWISFSEELEIIKKKGQWEAECCIVVYNCALGLIMDYLTLPHAFLRRKLIVNVQRADLWLL